MANKKINELSSRTPALSDLMIVGDPSSGYSYKCTITALATIIETDIADGYVTIGTTQTISGAKTFSNNLTLTSVVNTPTDPDKFLTLNASNVVTYRTGAEVLSDIGGQAALSGTGIVKSTGGTISYLTDNSSNWNTAYDNMIVSAAVTGTTTKTLTLTQQDAGTITASWTDINTDAVTSVFGRTGAVVATEGDYTLTQLGDVTITTPSTGQVLKYNGTIWVNDTDANTGTVTSVALSTGTTGTDISVSGSPITSSGTITLNIPTASATNRGALSSTDWTTFNNKQNALTLTTTGTSGAATLVGSTLNIPQYQGVLTNPVTGTGTTNYIPKFTSSSAIGNSNLYDASGSILIGKTSSDANNWLLQLYSTSGTQSGVQLTYGGVGSAAIWENSSGALVFGNDGASGTTERMRLTSGGSLGIGTSAPSYTLDVNGTIRASSYFTSDYYRDSRLEAMLIYAGSNQIRLGSGVGADFLTFYSGGSERMRLDASGNLLLGMTTAPSDGALAIKRTGSPAAAIKFHNASTGDSGSDGLYLGYGGSDGTIAYLYQRENDAMVFGTNNTERMRIDASGNLGLGTSAPTNKLDILTADNTGLTVRSTNYSGSFSPSGLGGMALTTNGAYPLFFYLNSATRMTLDASGNLGLGVTPSAWRSSERALQIGATTSLYNVYGITLLGNNYFTNSSNQSIYINSAFATYYWQSSSDGSHQWSIAPSGTAGNVISWTTAMTLDASGRLLVGGTSTYDFNDAAKLVVANTSGNSTITIASGTSSSGYLAFADGTSGTDRYTGNIEYNHSSNYMAFKVNAGAEAMRITSGGEVVVNGTTPIYTAANRGNITLSGTSGILSFSISSANSGYVYHTGTNMELWNTANGYLLFATNNTERMRITSGGELLINTTSDAGDYKLQVNGAIYGTYDITLNSYPGYGSGSSNFYYNGTDSRFVFNANLKANNGEFNGSIKTAAPSGGTAKPWKLGEAGVTLGGSNTSGVRVEIDGVVYYLVTGYLP